MDMLADRQFTNVQEGPDHQVKTRWCTSLPVKIAAIPVIDRELIPRSPRAIVMTSVNAAIAGLIVWSIYAGGIARGMDHVIAHGAEIDLTPISIVLTESVYGIDLGYVGLAGVYGRMMNVISEEAKKGDDPIVLRNLQDRHVINQAIAAGSSLGAAAMSYGYFSDGGLVTMMYQDLGSVDYIKLSFNLFGRRIEA